MTVVEMERKKTWPEFESDPVELLLRFSDLNVIILHILRCFFMQKEVRYRKAGGRKTPSCCQWYRSQLEYTQTVQEQGIGGGKVDTVQLPCLRLNAHLAEKVNAELNKNSISCFKLKKCKKEKQPLHVRIVTDSLLFSLSLCGKRNNWCLLNNLLVHKQSVKALLSQNTIVFTFSLRRRNNSANTITVTHTSSYAPFSFMLQYKVYKEVF